MGALEKTIYIISDGSGETAHSVLKAALVNQPQLAFRLIRQGQVRSLERIQAVFEEALSLKALIVFTLANPQLSSWLKEQCGHHGLICLDLLHPIVSTLSAYFQQPLALEPGALRVVDQNYFKRIEAIEFTVKHDDGNGVENLHLADLILVGLSRTSKTPLSIYLSYQGYRVANIPIVLNKPLPPELFRTDQRKIFGLTIQLEALQRIRLNRLSRMQTATSAYAIQYANDEHILRELDYAEQIFKSNRKWPVIDVTDRALEETASDIIKILSTRIGAKPYDF